MNAGVGKKLATGIAAVTNNHALFCHSVKFRQETDRSNPQTQDFGPALPYEAIPGPKPVPLIGNFWRFLPLIGSYPRDNQVELVKKLKKRYGKIIKLSSLPGRPDIVIVCDPKDFEKIYRTEGIWPKRDAMPSYKYYRDHVRNDFFDGVGSMVTEQGREWHSIRNVANTPMLNPKVASKYIQPINEVASDFVERMTRIRGRDEMLPATFSNELNKWALESVALLAMDTRLGCLDDPESPESSDAHRLVEAVLTMMKLTYDLDVSPSPMSAFRRKEFNRAVDVQIDISMKYINRCVERISRKEGESSETQSILEHVLTTSNKTVACVVAIDMLHAGIDTTARSMENALVHLSTNSRAQRCLREELKLVLPEVDSPVSQEDVLKLPYLKACIKESMRITPTAIGSLREVGKDVVLSGYQIPKGTVVAMYHVEASNSPEEFPEPQKYLPERWLRDSEETGRGDRAYAPSARNANPFSFLPFGFGPRACIGQRFANLEMEILLAKIFRRWKVTYDRDLQFQSKLLYGPATPLTFRLIDD
ncbi:probable cytochrome P450 49a1 isoform X1 [Neodiprion virginianus]|uniref:probable cytochrome P450 49a1 isoform X1 n=1 Tax=Neodiprion virginianus TaxID=2961670 RepID=UPI001EE73692|nr:probable cytochrome P450 49a1 isoform X1 [Neodiprion virginianus]